MTTSPSDDLRVYGGARGGGKPRWPETLPPEVSAEESREKVIQWAMVNCYDPHTITAAWYYAIPPGEVTPGQREVQKRANYVHLYSSGQTRLSDVLS